MDKESPIGDMHWLELRRINDKLARLFKTEKKIIAYTVVRNCDDIDDFEEQVNIMIKEGFIPAGGISAVNIMEDGCCRSTSEEWFYQAMVKYEPI